MAKNAPNPVATPFPPRNRRNTGKMCPTIASAGQVAKLTITKTYGARALTVITVRQLVE